MGRWAPLAIAILVLAAPAAQAHASASRTDPANLGGLPEAPQAVRIRFTEPLQPGQVWIGIFDASLLRRDLGNDNLSIEGDGRVLVVPTGHLTRGLYTISYEAVSAVDQHRETGSIPMSIGVPCPACLDQQAAGWRSWDPVQGLLRLAAYVAVAALAGETAQRVLLRRAGGRWRQAVVAVALAAQVAGAAQGTRPALALATAVAFGAGMAALPRPGPWAPGLAGGAALALLLQGGHSAGAGTLVALAHALPLLAWVGSLPGLLAWLRTASDEAGLRRYSRAATAVVMLLVATAAWLSWRRLPVLDAQVPYVQAWAAKLALVLGLLALAGWNHLRLWRRPAPVDLRQMRRGVRWEVALGALVVAATSVLATLAPPVGAGADRFTAAQWHGDVRVHLAITPAEDGQLAPGQHLHDVRLVDLEGDSIRGADVRLRFRHALLDVGSLEATLDETGARYRDAGTYLGAYGPWEVEVLFRLPGGLTEQRVLFNVPVGNVSHFHGGASIRDPHFDTGYLNPGGSYSLVFGADKMGTFQVHCHPHPWMQMRLSVDGGAAVSGSATVRILGDASDPAAAQRFEPAELAVRPGTEVRFVNEGDIAHTATNVRWTPPASDAAA